MLKASFTREESAADPGKEAPVAIMYEDAFVNVQAMTSLPRSHSPWITLAVLASNEGELVCRNDWKAICSIRSQILRA